MSGKKFTTLGFTVTLTLAALVALLWLLGGPAAAHADPATRYVAITGNDSSNDCSDNNAPCRTVQHAVDEAGPGDVILVAAGVYSDVHGRPVPADYMAPPELDTVYQVVYITKTISIQGGHTTPFTDPPSPEANPTTLDAQGGGRVVFIAGPLAGSGQAITTTIEGLRITGGDASGLYGEGGPRDAGGGIYSTDATTTISNNMVFSNSAYYGGGMYLRYNVATLNGNNTFSNTAYFGGGARLHRSDGVTVANNSFTSNTADSGGGLVVSTSDDVRVSGNTIISNTAATASGGGLHLQICSGWASGNTVISNTAQEQGGGVYLYASDQFTFSNNTVAANTAENGGGGIRLYWSDATLISNTITANTAESGGGLELWYSDATLNDNTIMANTATAGGGCGLFLGRSNAALINNVVADNPTPASTGSGLAIVGSSPSLLHTTIARNGGGQGYGVSVVPYLAYTSSVVMTNTILTDHKWGVYVSSGNAASLESTLWDNTFDWHGNGTIITGTHNYWGDPLFHTDGYHLTFGSAAIDKGVDAGVTTDIDGQPRPSDLGYEIGADEYYTLCTALTGVAITGPTEGYTGTLYTFSAVVTPSDATPPIAYTWSPEPESRQGTTSARYQWTVSSTHVITLTAENCGGSDVATHTITIETPPPGCPHPLVDIGITGPTSGYTGTLYTFQAIITSTGGTATPPVTYTWWPTPDAGQYGPVVTYTWTITGTKAITVTGENCKGAVKVVSDPHMIVIEAKQKHIYLPLVLRNLS